LEADAETCVDPSYASTNGGGDSSVEASTSSATLALNGVVWWLINVLGLISRLVIRDLDNYMCSLFMLF